MARIRLLYSIDDDLDLGHWIQKLGRAQGPRSHRHRCLGCANEGTIPALPEKKQSLLAWSGLAPALSRRSIDTRSEGSDQYAESQLADSSSAASSAARSVSGAPPSNQFSV